MSFAGAYGQKNYMGEFSSDANCLTWIQANKWDSSGDGEGDPHNGMWYYNTADHAHRAYQNGNWLAIFMLPGTPPEITGSRASNVALADLLTSLATLGLVTDSTTES